MALTEPSRVEGMVTCAHQDRALLNGYELIRKYECRTCEATLTCSCDAEIARYVLPHQASWIRDPATGRTLRVSHPLTAGVCFECRGEPRAAYPRIAHRGAATAIHRFYWRELWRTTELRFLDWCRGQGLPLIEDPNGETFQAYRYRYTQEYDAIAIQALAEIRQQHAQAPLYDTAEPSVADELAANHVTVRDIRACYVTPTVDRVLVTDEHASDIASAVGVEEFVAAQLRAQGREVMFCESRPLHALFSIMMWMWVQDPADPRCQISGFGGRDGIGADADGLILITLPSDFGLADYGQRRRDALDKHLAFIPDDLGEMLWTFDYWIHHAHGLRQYLWAYTSTDAERAREIIRVLGPGRVKSILRYLAEDYWGRYLGWPDLLSWREDPTGPGDPLFTEVKSGGDRVSADQLDFIRGNSRCLQLPFEIAKVHRSRTLPR